MKKFILFLFMFSTCFAESFEDVKKDRDFWKKKYTCVDLAYKLHLTHLRLDFDGYWEWLTKRVKAETNNKKAMEDYSGSEEDMEKIVDTVGMELIVDELIISKLKIEGVTVEEINESVKEYIDYRDKFKNCGCKDFYKEKFNREYVNIRLRYVKVK